ncbi:hypothetical protein BGZ74_009506 [Mortierella antarctica]|nr:hypothetical protein BGZ74_009506 [Mortierella antarctica]
MPMGKVAPDEDLSRFQDYTIVSIDAGLRQTASVARLAPNSGQVQFTDISSAELRFPTKKLNFITDDWKNDKGIKTVHTNLSSKWRKKGKQAQGYNSTRGLQDENNDDNYENDDEDGDLNAGDKSCDTQSRKVLLAIGLGDFSDGSGYVSTHGLFLRLLVRKARARGWCIVDIDEFFTPKLCPRPGRTTALESKKNRSRRCSICKFRERNILQLLCKDISPTDDDRRSSSHHQIDD